MLTRRQLLQRLLCGGSVYAISLLAACGQPEPTVGRPVGAGGAATALLVPTPRPGTPGTPGDLPTPTAIATAFGTVVLPTAPTDPYPRSGIRTAEVLPSALPYSTPRPEDPYRIEIIAASDGDPRLSTRLNDLIVIATVVELQPSRWSTLDGRRPVNPHDRQNGIYTPMFIEVEQVAKGTAPSSRLAVIVPGGTVGQDYIRYNDGLRDFEVGQRVVLFLKVWGTPPPQWNGSLPWHPGYRYTVTADQRATNSYETRPLAELLAIIANVAGLTPTPGGTPIGTPQRP